MKAKGKRPAPPVRKKNKHKGPKPFTLDGIPVEDATEPLVLPITPDDIKKGVRGDCERCPGALAGMRETGAVRAKVYRQCIYLLPPGKNVKWKRYVQSQPFQIEVKTFDKGGAMQADDYFCRVPPPRQRLTGRRQGSNAPGARDLGSPDRTPKWRRAPVQHTYAVRDPAPNHAT